MFKQANGLNYVKFLRNLHEARLFDWYLEIGCRTGRTFAPVRGRTIAVDPFFRADRNIIATKPELHVFQKTSDAFLASGFLEAMGVTLSFSFLDGMHLFEFLLRDFIGTERSSHPQGVIALHDCCPFNYAMTTRNLDNLPRDAWTGDVWKLIPILREFRPDLQITVLDAAPTGLVLVSGLDPASTVLSEAYDWIVLRFAEVTLEDYGLEAFNALFDYTGTSAFLAEGLSLFDAVSLTADQALNPMKVTP